MMEFKEKHPNHPVNLNISASKALSKGWISKASLIIDGNELEDEVGRNMLPDVIAKILEEALTEREKKIIEWRFGLYGGQAWTLEEVGKEFNVTRARIHQIEAKALRKLRHPIRSRNLKDML